MTGIPLSTQRHTGETPRENRGRDWSDASTRQGMPRIAGHHQKLAEACNGPSPLSPIEGTDSADTLISKSRREDISVLSSYLSLWSSVTAVLGNSYKGEAGTELWSSHSMGSRRWRAWWEFILERWLQPWRKEDTGEERRGRSLLQQRGGKG